MKKSFHIISVLLGSVVLLQWSGEATTQISFKANSAPTALPCYEGRNEESSSRYHMIISMVQS